MSEPPEIALIVEAALRGFVRLDLLDPNLPAAVGDAFTERFLEVVQAETEAHKQRERDAAMADHANRLTQGGRLQIVN